MVLRIDAKSSRELQAIILAIKRAPREVQTQIRKQTKAIGQAEWQAAMAKQATTLLEQRVLVSTARLSASNQNIRLSSATVGRPLSGGLSPKTSWGGVEFGSARYHQFRPRNRKGYVFYPAVARIVPRIAALWAQTTARVFGEALEGKSNG